MQVAHVTLFATDEDPATWPPGDDDAPDALALILAEGLEAGEELLATAVVS